MILFLLLMQYLFFSQAFNLVNNEICLYELHAVGDSGLLLSWIGEFFPNSNECLY